VTEFDPPDDSQAGRTTHATSGDGAPSPTTAATTGETAPEVGEDRSEASPSATAPPTNRRGERRQRRNDEESSRRRLDAQDRDEARPELNRRYTGGRNRNPMPWPTGPTRPLPPVGGPGALPSGPMAEALLTDRGARPTIPSAREETVELAPLPAPPATPGHPAAVPAQPDHSAADRTSRPARTATALEDAPADVWTLVDRAQGGDSDAFAQIYNRYLEQVFRFVYFRVGNRQVAEDLTAETFLRALRRIGSVTWQGRDLGAWLVTIARNLVADYFKSGRYRFEVATGDVLDADDALERGPEGSPEAAVVDHITNVALLSAVQRLNPEQRECIVLRFLQGFSVAETAAVMGKNEGAIKALQYRAVRSLHRLLPEGFQP
jgi:RNA polymerase sigma-70 factor (ECF subfamily)